MLEVLDVLDGVIRQTHQDVIGLEPSTLGGTIRIEMGNPDAAVLIELVVAVDAAVDRPGFAGDTEVGANYVPIANQHRDDPLGRVARHREADALRHRDDRGVDANHLASGIDEWSARVAGVQRGIRLDDVLDGAATLRPHGATDGADDTRSEER